MRLWCVHRLRREGRRAVQMSSCVGHRGESRRATHHQDLPLLYFSQSKYLVHVCVQVYLVGKGNQHGRERVLYEWWDRVDVSGRCVTRSLPITAAHTHVPWITKGFLLARVEVSPARTTGYRDIAARRFFPPRDQGGSKGIPGKRRHLIGLAGNFGHTTSPEFLFGPRCPATER
jgi:hypothetical protein